MFKYLSIVALLVACQMARTSAFWCFTCTTANSTNCLVPDQNILLTECPPSPQTSAVTCFTRVVGQNVERGCVVGMTQAEVDNCNLVNNCQLCSNENSVACNGNLFPHGRLTCHQCEGLTNSTCAPELESAPTPCLRFAADDQCFVQVRENTVLRGCTSENTGCHADRNCHACSGNGCNFRHFEHGAAASLVPQSWIKLLVGALALGAIVGSSL
ncbi:uncharacterized protein LOC131210713 [Anopheles bellator]|uniref:uncharacterized protein LOC131210713 n=1 Tax=Anopheles bellator TaxID=139047 RepID=UPI0026484B37|nr:uncharacterized protein LOC131210713 [Anopheles bellator]